MAGSVDDVRKQIDALDRELLAALNRRAGLGVEIGRIKQELGLAIEDVEREEAIIRQLQHHNPGPLGGGAVERIFRTIIAETKNIERLQGRGRS